MWKPRQQHQAVMSGPRLVCYACRQLEHSPQSTQERKSEQYYSILEPSEDTDTGSPATPKLAEDHADVS